MVYAHTIPVKEEAYDRKLQEWKDPTTWGDAAAIEEYTYCKADYTQAFRAFVKGAVGLSENYDNTSSSEILNRVDNFIHEIAYLNFIQELVKSNSQLAIASEEQVVLSKAVNKEYLDILQISHCICWGRPTYEYVKSISGYTVLSEEYAGKDGFSSCVIDSGSGRKMLLLRVYHPSMPGFDPYSKDTQKIIANFVPINNSSENS